MILAILFLLAGAAFAQTAKVAVVPFKMNAEKDLSFLRDGITDMLTSRLNWENKVTVLDRQAVAKAAEGVGGPINADTARRLGTTLGADYVLFGSLTVFGNSVSLDAAMVDTAGKSAPISVYNQSQGMEEVIPRINLFAEQINEKVFGRQTAVRQLAPAQPEAGAGVYTHPEKMLTSGVDDEDQGGAIRGARGIGFRSGFWKSPAFKSQLTSMALADVDGDGKTEVVLLAERRLSVHRMEAGRLTKVAELEGEKFRRFITVDAADIKKDGRAEIFVTAISTNDRSLDSMVFELSGKTLTPTVSGAHWYYRVIDEPGQGRILIGQRGGATDLFLAGIDQLEWKGSEYAPVRSLSLPKGANIYSFAMGKAGEGGADAVAVVDGSERIGFYRAGGQMEWKSEDNYGGSELFLMEPGQTEDRYFIPQRLLMADLNKDGVQEVVTVRHRSLSSRVFKNFRQFSAGQFEGLVWDGLGLTSLWHTREVAGYTADYAIGDFDNDGKPELVAAVVSHRELLMETPRSFVISFDMDNVPAAPVSQ